MVQQHTARRDLFAMLAYLTAVGGILAGLAVGFHSMIPPLSAEHVAEQKPAETTGTGSRVEQWKASREAMRQAVTTPVVETKSPPTTAKPVSNGPAYGTIAKKKAQAEMAAGKHTKRAAKQPTSTPASEPTQSMSYAPQPPRRSYGPFDHAVN